MISPFSLKASCRQRNDCIFFGCVCLTYNFSVFRYHRYVLFPRSPQIQPSYMDTCFCPLQPAIVLAPINCTQTTAPQIEEPSTKPEPQTTDDQSEDSPQHPPQETPQAENEEEKKSDWKARQERHLSFHFMFYFVGTFFFFLHCVSVKDILSTYGRLFALGAKGRAERRSVFSERLAQRSTGIGHTHTHKVETDKTHLSIKPAQQPQHLLLLTYSLHHLWRAKSGTYTSCWTPNTPRRPGHTSV